MLPLIRLIPILVRLRQVWTVPALLGAILVTILSPRLGWLVMTFVVVVVLSFPTPLAPGMTIDPIPPTTSLSVLICIWLGSLFNARWVIVVVQVIVTGLA